MVGFGGPGVITRVAVTRMALYFNRPSPNVLVPAPSMPHSCPIHAQKDNEIRWLAPRCFWADCACARRGHVVQAGADCFAMNCCCRYQYRLIPENIVHFCIAQLLNDPYSPSETDLEAACELLATVGALLDAASPASRRDMDDYFGALEALVRSALRTV